MENNPGEFIYHSPFGSRLNPEDEAQRSHFCAHVQCVAARKSNPLTYFPVMLKELTASSLIPERRTVLQFDPGPRETGLRPQVRARWRKLGVKTAARVG